MGEPTSSPPTQGSRPAAFLPSRTPLHDVEFVVLDLETTGMSPGPASITEIGAVKYRCGERLGIFDTLVDPGVPLAPFVSALTGITDAMVETAPRVQAVLPSLEEFLRGSVVVCHNVGFDRSFLDAALSADDRGEVAQPFVDTLPLSRRLLADEVPNHQLATIARYLRVPHQPCHRALADALATADVLHVFIERLATYGVFDLDALLAFPATPVPTMRATA
ncbi:MAG TPA: exonuclease domain-containing protein [Acidimicrobiia bacterium]|nr:exonuclease domain-containing protein [Acidimicrobiia bacterium]